MIELKIQRIYFDMILYNKKSTEARINYPSIRRYIKNGERVGFMCGKELLERIVVTTRYYTTIEDMLNSEEIGSLLPGNSKETAREFYEFIFRRDAVHECGIVVFNLGFPGWKQYL